MALDGTLLDASATSLRGIDGRLEEVVILPFWQTPWFTGTPGIPEMVPLVAAGNTLQREVRLKLPTG